MTPVGTAFRLKTICLPAIVVIAVFAVVGWAAHSPVNWQPHRATGAQNGVDVHAGSTEPTSATPDSAIREIVAAVDRNVRSDWRDADVAPVRPADGLQVLRRLSLALHGTIPSLEEIRAFESDASANRLERWTVHLLDDNRFADYFAERLARSFVGTEQGQFIVFRRDRFVDWLRQQLSRNAPYDMLVREMISETGLWTGRPATNYITAAVADNDLDENKLAGRTVRAFLGQRIDCAQCHDHPFAEWKQAQFEGLASLFGQTRTSLVGIEDKAKMKYEVEDRKTLMKHVAEPSVPFHAEWLPDSGTRREQLAAWITHPQNRRFERATVNRIWGLLFGKPYRSPVDDLPDPPSDGDSDVLDLIGADFRAHQYDLRRMIRAIVATRPFQLDSARPGPEEEPNAAVSPEPVPALGGATQGSPSKTAAEPMAAWAIFPMTRLRPEQLIGSILQASSLRTIDQNSHLFVRATRFFQERDFVKQYGDLGENELDERAATISQALLRMNGKLAADAIRPSPLNSTSRIATFADSDATCLEICYLVALTRRPTTAEADYFMSQLRSAGKNSRSQIVEDIVWSLFNSPEFSWNH